MTLTVPTDIDILVRRLPVAADNLAGLTPDWHLWPGWSDGMWPALARHLDGPQDDPAARYVAVIPFMFTWAVIVGHYRDVSGWHDDRWCYHNRTTALAAAHIWDGQGEPVGWHRHPDSARRRIHGDPLERTFTETDGCTLCTAQLFQHQCVHPIPCCPGTCPAGNPTKEHADP